MVSKEDDADDVTFKASKRKRIYEPDSPQPPGGSVIRCKDTLPETKKSKTTKKEVRSESSQDLEDDKSYSSSSPVIVVAKKRKKTIKSEKIDNSVTETTSRKKKKRKDHNDDDDIGSIHERSSSNMVTVTKASKKKKKASKKITKTAFKQFTAGLELPIKPGWFTLKNENYLMFSPWGRDVRCDTIGIDIGTKHLGIAGITLVPGRSRPVWSWCCLISVPTDTLHDSADRMVDILHDDSNFDWFRECNSYRIELQVQVNPKARAVAVVLRELCRVFQKRMISTTTGAEAVSCKQVVNSLPSLYTTSSSNNNRKKKKSSKVSTNVLTGAAPTLDNVEYVHGELKYAIAPLYSETARNDPLRRDHLSGASNTLKRKKLGKNDALCLLDVNGEKNMIKFLSLIGQFVDQLYDLTDAYLVGMTNYETDLRITRKPKIKPAPDEDDSGSTGKKKKKKSAFPFRRF